MVSKPFKVFNYFHFGFLYIFSSSHLCILISTIFLACLKGQIISKCLLGVIVWTKIATKKFDNFCPGGQIKKIKALFYINYGVFNVIKCLFFIWPPGQKLSNFFVAILVQTMTPRRHFEINWPLTSSSYVFDKDRPEIGTTQGMVIQKSMKMMSGKIWLSFSQKQ